MATLIPPSVPCILMKFWGNLIFLKTDCVQPDRRSQKTDHLTKWLLFISWCFSSSLKVGNSRQDSVFMSTVQNGVKWKDKMWEENVRIYFFVLHLKIDGFVPSARPTVNDQSCSMLLYFNYSWLRLAQGDSENQRIEGVGNYRSYKSRVSVSRTIMTMFSCKKSHKRHKNNSTVITHTY